MLVLKKIFSFIFFWVVFALIYKFPYAMGCFFVTWIVFFVYGALSKITEHQAAVDQQHALEEIPERDTKVSHFTYMTNP